MENQAFAPEDVLGASGQLYFHLERAGKVVTAVNLGPSSVVIGPANIRLDLAEVEPIVEELIARNGQPSGPIGVRESWSLVKPGGTSVVFDLGLLFSEAKQHEVDGNYSDEMLASELIDELVPFTLTLKVIGPTQDYGAVANDKGMDVPITLRLAKKTNREFARMTLA